MTLAPVSPAAYAQIVMDKYKLMRLFGVFQQAASVFCEGDKGNVLIRSNRAIKETGNQHENFRKRWLNKTSYLFPKKCVLGIPVI
jgi:hypothetical protein